MAVIDASESRELCIEGSLVMATLGQNTLFVHQLVETMKESRKYSFSLQDAKCAGSQMSDWIPKEKEIGQILRMVPHLIVYDSMRQEYHIIDSNASHSPAACGPIAVHDSTHDKAPVISKKLQGEMQENEDEFWNFLHCDSHLKILRQLFLETWGNVMGTTWVDSDGLTLSATAVDLRTALCFTQLPKPMRYPLKAWDITSLGQALLFPRMKSALSALRPPSSIQKSTHDPYMTLKDQCLVLVEENVISFDEFHSRFKIPFHGAHADAALAVRYIICHRKGTCVGFSAAVTSCLRDLTMTAFQTMACNLRTRLVHQALKNEYDTNPLRITEDPGPVSDWSMEQVTSFFELCTLPVGGIEIGQVDGGSLLMIYRVNKTLFTTPLEEDGFGFTRFQFEEIFIPQLAKRLRL